MSDLYDACLAATGNLAIPANPGDESSYARVIELIEAGADLAWTTDRGMAPLHCAAMTGNLRLAKILAGAGAPRHGRLMGAEGGSPLALALFYAHSEVAGFLADDPVPDNLRLAAALDAPFDRFLGGDGSLNQLAAAGRDFYRPIPEFPEFEPTNSPQETLDDALTYAARHDSTGGMARLVALGADVNANPYRGTPLLWAIYADKFAAAAWLLDHGADPDRRHDFGGREHGKGAVAMHLAAQFGAMSCLRLLLARGADPTIEDRAFAGTPLDWAVHSEQQEAADLLASYGKP